MYSIELSYSPALAREPAVRPAPQPVRLLDRLRESGYSIKTERTYVYWVRDFLRWHGTHRPGELGARAVRAFLTHLSAEQRLPMPAYEQALSAILFLYKEILGVDQPWLRQLAQPSQSQQIPAVPTPQEMQVLLDAVPPASASLARLLYGTGMRLKEALQLRVKDVDFARGVIVVRGTHIDKSQGRKLRGQARSNNMTARRSTRAGSRPRTSHMNHAGWSAKAGRQLDRLLPLPSALADVLRAQLAHSRRHWEADREADRPGVAMPGTLAEEYPHAGETWAWHWVFPAVEATSSGSTKAHRRHARAGRPAARAQSLLLHLRQAAKAAGIATPVSVQTLRHACAVHLLSSGATIPGMRAQLGHANAESTHTYLHALKAMQNPGAAVGTSRRALTPVMQQRDPRSRQTDALMPLPLHPPRSLSAGALPALTTWR